MTVIASQTTPRTETAQPAGVSRLSTRLILLTALFVLGAQVLVYVPAVSAFRVSWLQDKVVGTQMVALALTAAPKDALPPRLEARLLEGIGGARALGVRGPGMRWLLASDSHEPPAVDGEIDLRDLTWRGAAAGAFWTLVEPPRGMVRVIGDGAPGIPGAEWVELVIDEAPLRAAVLGFSQTFLFVSLLISGGLAILLYLAMHATVVKPVRRLTENIAAFAANPADASRILTVSGRTDELGRTEAALASMEATLAAELRQKRHLAELGLAVSKINHELRNMLTTAQLLSDRLGAVEDPAVKTIAPRLIRTLDRAIAYCEATLAYGRVGEERPERRRVALAPIVSEQLDIARAAPTPIDVEVDIADDLVADVDPEQFGRVVLNLVRNAVTALGRAGVAAPALTIAGWRTDGHVAIRVRDNGPGVPDGLRPQLFNAFQVEDRGGTGLGLPVVHEIVAAHGGTVMHEPTATGASFLVTIPDLPG